MKTAEEYSLPIIQERVKKNRAYKLTSVTEEEYINNTTLKVSDLYKSANRYKDMESYAKYYHEQKLKELTNDVIDKHLPAEIAFMPVYGKERSGVRWAKEWYLKNNK